MFEHIDHSSVSTTFILHSGFPQIKSIKQKYTELLHSNILKCTLAMHTKIVLELLSLKLE